MLYDGTSVTFNEASGGCALLSYRYASTVNFSQFETSTSSTLAMPEVITNSLRSVLLAFAADRDPSLPTPPGGFTTRLNNHITNFGLVAAEKPISTIGPTGTVTFTGTGAPNEMIGGLLEVLPI